MFTRSITPSLHCLVTTAICCISWWLNCFLPEVSMTEFLRTFCLVLPPFNFFSHIKVRNPEQNQAYVGLSQIYTSAAAVCMCVAWRSGYVRRCTLRWWKPTAALTFTEEHDVVGENGPGKNVKHSPSLSAMSWGSGSIYNSLSINLFLSVYIGLCAGPH